MTELSLSPTKFKEHEKHWTNKVEFSTKPAPIISKIALITKTVDTLGYGAGVRMFCLT